MSYWDIQNIYWYCTDCNKFTQETYAIYRDCAICSSRLKKCSYLLHMCKNYRNLVDNYNSLSELIVLCKTCDQRFKCWTEQLAY